MLLARYVALASRASLAAKQKAPAIKHKRRIIFIVVFWRMAKKCAGAVCVIKLEAVSNNFYNRQQVRVSFVLVKFSSCFKLFNIAGLLFNAGTETKYKGEKKNDNFHSSKF